MRAYRTDVSQSAIMIHASLHCAVALARANKDGCRLVMTLVVVMILTMTVMVTTIQVMIPTFYYDGKC